MAGGERERKGKKKESRFNDRRKPRPTKDELQSLALKREGSAKCLGPLLLFHSVLEMVESSLGTV